MGIEDRIEATKHLLDKVRTYNRLVVEDSLEPPTIVDMKGNAKAICDNAKIELDNIKGEIDLWS